MLTSIRVLEWHDEEFVDFLAGSNGGSDGLRIVDVDGLEPVPAQVRYTEHVMVPGVAYNSTTINARNIVIKAEIHSDYINGKSVQELRREVYRVCMPGTLVRVRLYNNYNYEMRVDGYVESVEPVIFSKEPQIQVSIICPTPYMRSPSETLIENLTPEIRTFDYNSEIPWGLTLDVRPNRTIQWIEVQDFNEPIDSRPTLRINHTFQAGHRVRIVTQAGSKEVSLRDDATGTYIQSLIGRASTTNGWPQLRTGGNRIRVRGSQNDALRWDVTLIRRFGGF